MINLEVTRVAGAYPSESIVSIFRSAGVVVLKEYFSRHTRQELREALEGCLKSAAANNSVLRLPQYPKAEYLLGDLLSLRKLEDFDYVFFRKELLDVVRLALGSSELLYFGDSSVQFGEAARGFHKDNVDRSDGRADDWAGDYGLLRCAFYCQDHVSQSGGLKVRLGSHNIPTHTKGRMFDIKSSYGDVLLWNMRLTHSGNNRKLRLLPRVPLHPRLEMLCPSALTTPEQMRRISAFCAFAKPGTHADRYIKNLDVRSDDYRDYLMRARKPAEAMAILSKLNVTLRLPNDSYGALD